MVNSALRTLGYVAWLGLSACDLSERSLGQQPGVLSSSDSGTEPGDDANASARVDDASIRDDPPASTCDQCEALAAKYIEGLETPPEAPRLRDASCAIVLDTNESYCDCGVDDTVSLTSCGYPSLRTGLCLGKRAIQGCESQGAKADAWCALQCANVRAAAEAEAKRTFDATLLATACRWNRLCTVAVDLEGDCHQALLSDASDGSVFARPDIDSCALALCENRQKCTVVE